MPELPSEHADVSPEKAEKILKDGEVRGHKLTEKQRGMFGAIVSKGRKKRASMKTYARAERPIRKSQEASNHSKEAKLASEQARKTTDSHMALKQVGGLAVKSRGWKEHSDRASNLGASAETPEQHQSAANAHSRAADEHSTAAEKAASIRSRQQHDDARRAHSAASQKHLKAAKSTGN